MAAARATRCFWPLDSSDSFSPRSPSTPHVSAAACTRRTVSAGSTPRFSAENAISSPTVPMKNWLRGSCITTPRRSVRSRGASRRTSAPHTSTTPVRSPGKNVPANPSTRRNTVDLPSPERPHSTRQRPGATDSDTSSTRLPDAGAAEPASASNPRSDSST